MRTSFTLTERVAIASLVHDAELLADCDNGKPSKQVQCLAAVILERAANIIRGELTPVPWTDEEVVEFATFWKTDERAAFNPLKG